MNKDELLLVNKKLLDCVNTEEEYDIIQEEINELEKQNGK